MVVEGWGETRKVQTDWVSLTFITTVLPQISAAFPTWPDACTRQPGLTSTLESRTYFMGLKSACP